MNPARHISKLFSLLALCPAVAVAMPGADMPWTTYEAEKMATTGVIMGPNYGPNMVEAESSGQQCVLLNTNEHVEFQAQAAVNAMVVRYSLIDAQKGGGLDSSLSLFLNGKLVRKIPITSRYSWLYGNYPFSNDPAKAYPRNFYDEARLKDINIKAGDVVRLEKDADQARYCVIDLVDLEKIAPPLAAPPDSLSLTQFGAKGNEDDSTLALRECIAAAQKQGKSVWIPPGVYKIAGDIDIPGNVSIRGAGMWHTIFVGDPAQYASSNKRVRFNGRGDNIHISDFAIIGRLDFRNDTEPNDGFQDSYGANSSISRVWMEHTKAGIWVNNSTNLLVDGCRFRNTIADGVNFCVGMRNSTIQNCAARGTGDDCFAIWPATHAAQTMSPGHNVIRRCTGQLPFLANGAAIYGGDSNRIEDSMFTDILSGCGILISTTFPTQSDKFDNNFSGTTVIRDSQVSRCGGFDPWRAWRSAIQLCVDRRDISGIRISNVEIKESIADAFSVVASQGEFGQKTLSDAVLENVSIPDFGIGVNGRNSLWVRWDARGSMAIRNSNVGGIKNDSASFNIIQK
jgi:hypothetical protein